MARKNVDWEQRYQETLRKYTKLAKRANQRMVRLERYAKEREGMSELAQYAYARAQSSIAMLYKKSGDKLRYTEHPKLETDLRDDNGKKLTDVQIYKYNIQSLKIKLKSIDIFLESKSSTIGNIYSKGLRVYDPEKKRMVGVVKKIGFKEVYDKRTSTINQKWLKDKGFGELELTKDDLKRFFESKKQEKLQKDVGSDFMFVVAAIMKHFSLTRNKREMNKFLKENLDLKVDPRDYEDAADLLKENGALLDMAKGDEVLANKLEDALKSGISVKNIFI